MSWPAERPAGTVLAAVETSPGSGRLRIRCQGAPPFVVEAAAWTAAGCRVGALLDVEQWTQLCAAKALVQLRARALRLLGVRAYSREGLRRRLLQPPRRRNSGRGRSASRFPVPAMAQVDATLDELVAKGYLDDVSYARDVAESLLRRRPQGESALIARLRREGVASALAQNTVADLLKGRDPDRLAISSLERVWFRYAALPPDVRRRRSLAFLQRRGFGYEAASRALEAVAAAQGDIADMR